MSVSVSHFSPDFLRRVSEAFAPLKRRTHELMGIGPGSAALDLGCGPATDTLALAEIVGSSGRVGGVDAAREMIQVADERVRTAGATEWVRHVLADASSLPLETGSFDACRSERVFQHLADPEGALAELHRVTRPGGRVVVADPDLCSMSIDTRETDTEWRLFHSMAEIQQNGYSARTLYRLFKQRGFADVRAEVVPLLFHDYAVLRVLLRVKLDELLRHSGLGMEAFERLEKGIEDAVKDGTFFGYVNMVVVAGER